ncbi:D-glycero-alpha-D-manno-heptose-1,7-bisphosphate 7-phosphatase [Pedobacter montanisoli]|uniref:D,D-heptose 1,7-bisphosphate phosphatase n=1 Tax=Pedobacter montanisoli TaxID=2923277 RepID=A0ABS9ZYN4_9SPHI|nr:HAD family hydrolase [Pedobacter montanisoli]MCJ0743404.1 HAD family hydrolase [Pedobacter montanisoli]
MEANKAIFLDKDGTLIPNIPYNVNPDLISLNKGVLEGLEILSKLGYLFIIISNQAGIAKGYFEEEDLIEVEQKIKQLFDQKGIHLSGFYYCPHLETGSVPRYAVTCNCRKPNPDLILAAAKEHHIDLTKSWMIGDILDDVEAGKAAGCRSILIDNGNENEWCVNGNLNRVPNWIAPNFLEASLYISHHYKLKEDEQGTFEYSQEI